MNTYRVNYTANFYFEAEDEYQASEKFTKFFQKMVNIPELTDFDIFKYNEIDIEHETEPPLDYSQEDYDVWENAVKSIINYGF